MTEYLKSMKYSAFFLFSCGSVVDVESAQAELKRMAKKWVVYPYIKPPD